MQKVGLTQRVERGSDRHERRDCLDQAWTRLLAENGYWPVPLPNLVEDVDIFVCELGLSGVILTGGNDLAHLPNAQNEAPARDIFERKLLAYCDEKRIPVLGVCRGLQMMIVHYGGRVVRVSDHVATDHAISLRSPSAMPLTDRDRVNSFHCFGIREDTVGPDLQVVASAPDGSVEAVVHKRLSQWGIMWHPERAPYDARDVTLLHVLFRGQSV